LEALASVASPLQVVSLASVPGAPSSPKPVQDGVIGLVLGLLLGLLIAILRSALDRRMRASDDIRGATGLPLLGHVRETALGHAGDIPRGDKQLAPRDIESFRMLRTNTEFLTSNGSGPISTFAVTSALAEEGKSTTAAALAFAYAASGRRTLLVECDLRLPCLAERLGLQPNGGLTSYLVGRATLSDVVFRAQARSHASTLAAGSAINPPVVESGAGESGGGMTFGGCPDVVVAGDRPSHPAELLSSPGLARFISEARARYDIVILDTAPLLSVADTLEILPQVEGIVLCVRARRTTRDQIAACTVALDRVPARPTGVVVTGISDRENSQYGYYGYAT
jgi:Mrp family chromosome partitioning ATPase